MTEFDCEGCGVHVIDVGRIEPPRHGFCAVCDWLNDFVAPVEIMEARRRFEAGGWVSEREQRGPR